MLVQMLKERGLLQLDLVFFVFIEVIFYHYLICCLVNPFLNPIYK
jgi:hypothetical protein